MPGVDQSLRILKSMCGLVDLLVSYFYLPPRSSPSPSLPYKVLGGL